MFFCDIDGSIFIRDFSRRAFLFSIFDYVIFSRINSTCGNLYSDSFPNFLEKAIALRVCGVVLIAIIFFLFMVSTGSS